MTTREANESGTELSWQTLCQAVQESRQALEFARMERVDSVRLTVGTHCLEHGSRKRQPVNLLSLYKRIVLRNLISKNPRFGLRTFERSLKPTLSAIESFGNQQLKRMKAVETFREVADDALHSIGILKVGLTTPGESALSGFAMKAGMPSMWRVDLDDFVYDIHARDFRFPSFIGHRYRVPRRSVTTDKTYGRERKDIVASEDPWSNESGDERISSLGRGQGNILEFEEMVDLWEFYLPRHRLIVTFQSDTAGLPVPNERGKPLKVQKWVGPYCGPYHFLRLGRVSANAMPHAPIMDLIDMHEAVNRNWRKTIDQMGDQKTVLLVPGMLQADVERLMRANNSEAIRYDGPPPTPVDYGGPNAAMFQATDAMTKLFSWLAGNLDMLGGLSPQSKTLGQDKLLAQNASGAMIDMQEEMVNLTSSAIGALCWYWIKNPFDNLKTAYPLPGLPGEELLRTVTPVQRLDIDFDEVDVVVEPYSLRHQTPGEQAQALQQLVTATILPLMPLMQQQGIGFDLNVYLTKLGKLLDQPDLVEILTVAEPPMESAGRETPRMPQSTERTYTRRSLGADSPAAQENELSNAFSEAAAAMPNGQPQTNGVYR